MIMMTTASTGQIWQPNRSVRLGMAPPLFEGGPCVWAVRRGLPFRGLASTHP